MNQRYVLIAVCFVIGASLRAETIKLSSRIAAVTVYEDRAIVTRSGEISLRPGTHTLSFENLPVDLIDQSVRVSGEAEGAKILDVRVETTFLDTIPEERIQTLQARVQELQAQVNELNDRLSVLASEREFLSQIKAQSAENISKDLKVQRPTVEDWQKVLGFLDANLNKNFTEQRKIVANRSDLQAKIDALQRQIGQISPGSRKSRKTIFVDVDVVRDGAVTLHPTYVVYGARWQAQYDVRVTTESRGVELTYRGLIEQNTGEDWNNIDLSLSTARPDVGSVRPELYSWFVNVAQPPHPMLKNMTNKPQLKGEEVVITSAQGVAMDRLDVPVAGIESQQTSALFHISAKSTIASDNVPHAATIAIEKLPAEFSYASTPKLSPYVYLRARVKNTTEAPFLTGRASIYSNDDFVASSALKPVAPGESFDAYLGIDPAVKIERKMVNKFTDYTGTFTKNVRVSYEFSYSLENTTKSEQKVTVQDHLPISQNEKILVEQIEPAEKELRRDDMGVLTWIISLQAGEKKSWKLKFNVEYPQGTSISGLD